MKLQRYDLWVDAHRVEIVADADNEFGTWVKASDAVALEQRTRRLEWLLREFANSEPQYRRTIQLALEIE
jgi:hypothetical protein